jgi:prepilin-type N-terminal cleavage/methylation domain
MNKRGFTMVELMVYLAIVGIVVIIAGRAFSNSTSMRMESESMIKANQESENLGVLLRDDFAQMGAKTVLDSVGINGSHGKMKIVSAVYMDTAGIYKDSSSFKYFPGKKTPRIIQDRANQDWT